jgi:ATP-binding cassette subfamily F protein uup
VQYTYVSKLSGGEKRRLHLLTVLIKNPNFLVLDEPTNDLDLLTLGILEEFLMNYTGCLLVVSHDRYFMDKLVDHLFIFEGEGKIRDYNGSYSEYRISEDEKEKNKLKAKQKPEEPKSIASASSSGSNKRKLSFKEKFELETVEKELSKLEEEKKQLTEKLSSGSGTHDELNAWAKQMEKVIKEIDDKSVRWLELSEISG